jgi:WD40 repeat protein
MRPILLILFLGVSAQAQSVRPYLRIETGAHAACVRRIDVDAAERFLVSASEDKTARVWDLRSGRLLTILRPPTGDGDEGMLFAVALSPDGTTVAVGGFTGAATIENQPIYIFDRESGAIRSTIPTLPEVTNHIAYSRDGRYLAAGLGSGGIRIFESTGYSEVFRDANYADHCLWLEFDQSGRLVTASLDGFVRLYSPDSTSHFHLLRKERPRDDQQPYSARFSPDGKLIAVGGFDSTAVDVLSAEDLSFRYKVEAPWSSGDLAKTSWSEHGQTLCASGRYTSWGAVPLLCWSDRGKGSLSTFAVASFTLMAMRALQGGAILFCDGGGTVGVLDPNGVTRWRAAPDLLDYGGGPAPEPDPSFPRLSSDGNNLEVPSFYFNGTTWTRHDISFSVSDQRLEIDAKSKSPLQAPRITGLAVDRWQNNEHPKLDGRILQLEPHERSMSLAISPNKDSFVLAGDWYLRRFGLSGKPIWVTPVPGTAWGVNISDDGRFVVATLSDGTARWYTFESGREVLALFVDRDLRRWVAWNPDGFFTFQGGADALIGYQINRGPGREGGFVKVDQLREAFYQPDLIAQILKPGGAEAVLAARNRIGDISRILSSGLPPEIELISSPQATVADEYLLQLRIKDMGGGHGRIVYRIDGAEIEGRAVDIAGTGSDTNNRYIPVASGSHTLTITAYDAKGKIEGPPKTVQVTRTLPALGSNLYVIAAGISHYSDHSLWDGVKFASADAEMVAARFKEQEGKGLYGKVNAVALPDSQATVKNIQSEVAKAAKAVGPGDTFILYLAGHGIAVEGEYYFIPWEAEYKNQQALLSKSLNREAIQALLKQVNTNKSALILDTCGSGAFLEARATESSEKAAIERVALMSGHAVLAASNSDEMAMDGYQNHGVFTYALLEGLKRADSNAQGQILITRLAEFVQSRVPDITEEKWHYRQSPLSRIDGEPFPIARKPAN